MRVIKVGGRVQRDPRLAAAIASLWRGAPASFCVVHGGGDTITALQSQLGGAPRFVDGRRVTTEADISVLRMALSGVANKQLVDCLSTEGISAVGVSGEDASLIVAHPLDAPRLGRVGTPVEVNDGLLHTLFAAGHLPVVSPVSRDGSATGGALNVNADDAAAAIACALDADELLLVSDVPGVLVNGAPVRSMSYDDASDALEHGIATEGMATKLRAALDAMDRGVPRVRIGGLDSLSHPTLGTILLATPQPA